MPTDNTVEARGTFTIGDLVRYQYFHCFRRTWWLVLGPIVVLLVGVIMAGIVAFVLHDYELARQNGTPFLLVLIFLGAVVILPYTSAKKIQKTQTGIRGPLAYSFSLQGVQCVTSVSSSQSDWSALWRVCETKSLYALYFGAGSAWLVPKRFFQGATEQNEWRQLVEQQIAPKRIIKPGVVARWC